MFGNTDKFDYSGGLPSGFESFPVIEDPRTGGTKKHHFGEVFLMAVTGVLCGMNGFADIEGLCIEASEWFGNWIEMPNGIPRAQTFSAIFATIGPDLFNRYLIGHLGTLCLVLPGQIIAIDGTVPRCSHELSLGMDHVVSAWVANTGAIPAQKFVSEKSNEIMAIPKLPEAAKKAKKAMPGTFKRRLASTGLPKINVTGFWIPTFVKTTTKPANSTRRRA